MLAIDATQVVGLDAAIRGMRNPKNSWDRIDSAYYMDTTDDDYPTGWMYYSVGENDLDLMKRLAKGGPVHAKYRRMIVVYLDVVAPLYWWKEFDTYKVGTVANSCSTMHKIHAKQFEPIDFSLEHLDNRSRACLNLTIERLNEAREEYLKTKSKDDWWQMIQLLPSSYMQRRTIMLNYEVLTGIYASRKNHKLDEWHRFCAWIETLPHSELITGEVDNVET